MVASSLISLGLSVCLHDARAARWCNVCVCPGFRWQATSPSQPGANSANDSGQLNRETAADNNQQPQNGYPPYFPVALCNSSFVGIELLKSQAPNRMKTNLKSDSIWSFGFESRFEQA